MQTGYFSAAWHDIKNSPGWFGKMLVLGLVSIIPVFGWIVVGGYLYGWARDIAWGVHAPLPAQVFGNEDGKLYSRGFFVMIICFVCALIPWVVELVGSIMTGGSFGLWHNRGGFMPFPLGMLSGILGMVFFVLSIAASLFAVFFGWIGSIRMSIYGRLSAGFQFGKIWNMLRHDFSGMLRILGMALLLSIGVGIIVMMLVFLAAFIGVAMGFFVTGGNVVHTNQPNAAIMSMIFGVGGIAVVLLLLAGFASMVITVFITAMIARAVGYWARQFNVPAWHGQDDPMPFELMGTPKGSGSSGPGQPPSQQPPL